MINLIEPFPELDNITPIPIPFNEVPFLLTSNVYALGREDITLIDAGPGIPGAIDFLKETMARQGLKFENIRRIILTHGHMDHFGLTSTILKELDHAVEIFIHPEELWKVTTEFFNQEIWLDEMKWLQKQAGIPDDAMEIMIRNVRKYYSIAKPIDDLKPMEDNELFSGDGYNLKIVYAPGHAPGLCCIYETEHKVLFSSDHILKNLTPKPIMPLSREKLRDMGYRSLIAYEKSLDRVSRMDVQYIFPGHGEWISDMNPVIEQYRKDHSQRRDLVWQAVNRKESPLYYLVKDVFPHAEKDDLFIALSELISHLEVLVQKGRAEIIDQGPPVIYRAI
ncbi:MBL fold metallo-hydrolase [Thermodesulfobacteriota bacterium]